MSDDFSELFRDFKERSSAQHKEHYAATAAHSLAISELKKDIASHYEKLQATMDNCKLQLMHEVREELEKKKGMTWERVGIAVAVLVGISSVAMGFFTH